MKYFWIVSITLFILLSCGKVIIPGESLLEKMHVILTEKAEKVSLYKSASLQAEKEGYGSAAVYLSELARSETNHILLITELLVTPKKKHKLNLKELIRLENKSIGSTYPILIRQATEEHHQDVVAVLQKIQREEKVHLAGLKGLLKGQK